MVRPLIFVWPHALPFWVLYALVVVPEMRLQKRSNLTAETDRAQDHGSVRIIHAADFWSLVLALFASVFLSGTTVFVGRELVFVLGTMAIAAGGLLRRHCFRMLGPFFTGTVHVVKDQPIVERGAYRYLRHPAYTGGFLISTGIGLTLTNWVSVGFMALGSAVGYWFRVRAEERALLDTLGEPYRKYMERTKRFIPFVF
jgi:protein-S-isoprenylcysteine O-methyltransferase Ste14